MATISCHALDAARGSHAAGLGVTLRRCHAGAPADVVFANTTDAGGRLLQSVQPDPCVEPAQEYELVLAVADYWAAQPALPGTDSAVRELRLRFRMDAPNARYHFPVSITPSSYSLLLVVQEP